MSFDRLCQFATQLTEKLPIETQDCCGSGAQALYVGTTAKTQCRGNCTINWNSFFFLHPTGPNNTHNVSLLVRVRGGFESKIAEISQCLWQFNATHPGNVVINSKKEGWSFECSCYSEIDTLIEGIFNADPTKSVVLMLVGHKCPPGAVAFVNTEAMEFISDKNRLLGEAARQIQEQAEDAEEKNGVNEKLFELVEAQQRIIIAQTAQLELVKSQEVMRELFLRQTQSKDADGACSAADAQALTTALEHQNAGADLSDADAMALGMYTIKLLAAKELGKVKALFSHVAQKEAAEKEVQRVAEAKAAAEKEIKRLADEKAAAKKVADDNEAKRLAAENEAKRQAAKKVVDDNEAKRLAAEKESDDNEAKRLADEKAAADKAAAEKAAADKAVTDKAATDKAAATAAAGESDTDDDVHSILASFLGI